MVRLKAVCVAVALFLAVLAAGPALVFFARSRRGRVAGLIAVAVVVGLASGLVWLGAPAVGVAPLPAMGWVTFGAFAFVPPLCAIFVTLGRKSDSDTGSVGSHLLNGAPAHEAVGWSDLEDEYVWLLILLVTRFDPLMPGADARATRAKVDELLRAVAERPDYQRLARVGAGTGYRLIRGELDPRHCYSYRPEPREPGERFGLLVFLHGHGSNYLFVVHALRPLCDRMRLCLVAPTFGYGNWEVPGGTEAIDRATRFGLAAFDADPARVFLAGISQGGAGVSRAGAAHPQLFAGLIFISPTMELSVIGSQAFSEGWRDRSVLVIQGERDYNVHPRTVDAAVERMETDRVKVAQHRDPDAGHFLFFAKLNEITDVIADWMANSLRGGV